MHLRPLPLPIAVDFGKCSTCPRIPITVVYKRATGSGDYPQECAERTRVCARSIRAHTRAFHVNWRLLASHVYYSGASVCVCGCVIFLLMCCLCVRIATCDARICRLRIVAVVYECDRGSFMRRMGRLCFRCRL